MFFLIPKQRLLVSFDMDQSCIRGIKDSTVELYVFQLPKKHFHKN